MSIVTESITTDYGRAFKGLFKVGDVVQLNSGGPEMTVTSAVEWKKI